MLPVALLRGMHRRTILAALAGMFAMAVGAGVPGAAETDPKAPSSPPLMQSADVEHWEKDGVREEYTDEYSRIVFSDILGDGHFRYRFLPDPPRLYVDILQPKRKITWDRLRLKGEAFRQMRVGRYPDKVRITFDVRNHKLPEPLVHADGRDLIIMAAGSGSVEPLPVGGPEISAPARTTSAGPSTLAKAGWKPVRVKKIDFRQTDASSDVIVETDGKALYDVRGEGEKILLVMPGTQIPSHLLRHIDTKGFPSSILSIVPEQVSKGPAGQAKITILLRTKKPFDVVRENGTLRVRVQLPDQPPAIEPLPAPQIPEGMKDQVKKVEADKAAVKQPKAAKAVQKKPAPKPKAAPSPKPVVKKPKAAPVPVLYKGRKISLDFKDADIQNVLRLIAEVSGQNIVISDAVQGKVTIRLLNVPWDQALDVILRTYALDKEELAPNILRVAPFSQLRTERDEALRAAQALDNVEKLVTVVVPLNYAQASQLQSMLSRLKSSRADASILVDSRTNSLVLKDLPDNISEMKRLVGELDGQTPQVLIEAKIVELDVDFERELGIQWGTLYRAGPATGNPTGMDFPHTASIGGAAENITGLAAPGVPNPVVNLPAAIDQTQGGALGFSLASITNSLRLDAQLSALERNKHARILSSPRVATLNNMEAKIEQGQEVPFTTTSDEGTKTEFKDAMLRLFVTPQINFDRSIIMNITVSNDTPIKDPTVGFIIQKKEAITSVLVNDGDTAVIGGIYTNTDQKTGGGVPLFQDIPGLGHLFKKGGKLKTRTELIIFITPRIIPVRKIAAEEWMK